ncbi:MAG TPA: hypothetical protein VGP32_02030 [Steroidobacteraceae bacterium]|jgi:hypothetical protein|nr:hypothetical protein [Steroidobacteraceae bacterium]
MRASCWSVAAVLWTLPFLASAQQGSPATPPASPAPAREIPRPDELEPAVSTTPEEPARAAPSAPGAAAVPAGAAPTGSAGSAASAATPPGAAAQPGGAASEEPAAARGKAPASKAAARKGPDRLELDTTEITGNRELPKVLYIVPWKRSDLGDLVGKPVNSLLDEVLQPLDRDVFQRENRYYEGLKPGSSAPKAGAVQGSGSNP